MSRFIPTKPVSTQPQFAYGTSCPAGAFDTSARLDVQAALIRNQTWTVGPALPNWGSDYAVPSHDAEPTQEGVRDPMGVSPGVEPEEGIST